VVTTDNMLTLVTMGSIEIIVCSASIFTAVNSVLSEMMVTGGILIKFVMT
jgi:hypothetical protein